MYNKKKTENKLQLLTLKQLNTYPRKLQEEFTIKRYFKNLF